MIVMKKYFACIIVVTLCFLFFGQRSFAQPKERSYAASRFTVQLNGSKKGFLKPVEKGDTLIYTIDRLADSVLVRKKFDSTFSATGKKYYLQYKLRKNLTGVKVIRKPD